MGTPVIDQNTGGTTIVLFVAAYLIGSINPSRIYISIKFKGNTNIKRKDGSYYKIRNFGTSQISKALGLKMGIIQFLFDFFKATFFMGCILLPLKNNISQFTNVFVSITFVGIILGNNFPIFGKFKGGEGIAAGVGIVTVANPIVGIMGIASGLFINIVYKNNLKAAFGAMFLTASLNSIPYTYSMGETSVSFMDYSGIYSVWIVAVVIAYTQYSHKGGDDFIKNVLFIPEKHKKQKK